MDNERKFDLQEALCRLVVAQSKGVEAMVEQLDDTEVFTKDDLLLTNKQVTQLVGQLVNIKE